MCYALTKQNMILASMIINSKVSTTLRKEEKWFLFEKFVKQMKNLETIKAEPTCLELTIVKKKCIIFAYRRAETNEEEFCDEISVSLIKIFGKHDIALAGELNVDEVNLIGESHIDFLTQCVIMTLGVDRVGVITNEVLKFRETIEFQSS